MSLLAWYVVQSQPRREGFVRDRIEDLGREVFLPLMAERVPGRRRDVLGPMFPSYLFARLSEDDGDIPKVRWSQGVLRILGEGGSARPVDDRVVDTLRVRADRRGRVRLGDDLRKGQRVRVLSGPLAGLVGIVDQPGVTPGDRVRILLEIFRRTTPVMLAASAVRGLARA